MKIAIVVNTAWNIYNFRRGLIQFLLEQNCQIYTIAPYDEYTEKLEHLGCHVVSIKLDNKGINPFKDITYLNQLLKVYASIRPDIILHYTIKPNIYGTIASYLLGIPALNNVSGLGTTFLRKHFSSFIAHFLYRLSFRFAKKVFFQNPDDLHIFLQKKLVKKSRTDLLPGSGVNLKEFQPAPTTENKIFKFLLIGRLIRDKGILEYVEASRIFRKKNLQAEFLLLGALEKNDTHSLHISNTQLKQWHEDGLINYVGVSSQVQHVIAQADCVVLPSYREGTPRSLLEAAAMAKPLVATDVPGCREIVIPDQTGWLCQPKSAQSLAEILEMVLKKEKNELNKIGDNARQRVEKLFDENIVIQKYWKVIQEITSLIK